MISTLYIEAVYKKLENIMNLLEIESEIRKNKCEFEQEICSIKIRVERAIKDQNDKLDAVLEFLGATMTKNEPRNNIYTVEKNKEAELIE